MDHAKFLAAVRSSLFGGRLSANQVDGMKAILAAWRAAPFDTRWIAYMLATAYQRRLPRAISSPECGNHEHAPATTCVEASDDACDGGSAVGPCIPPDRGWHPIRQQKR